MLSSNLGKPFLTLTTINSSLPVYLGFCFLQTHLAHVHCLLPSVLVVSEVPVRPALRSPTVLSGVRALLGLKVPISVRHVLHDEAFFVPVLQSPIHVPFDRHEISSVQPVQHEP